MEITAIPHRWCANIKGLTGLESGQQPSNSWAELATFCKLFGDQAVIAAPPPSTSLLQSLQIIPQPSWMSAAL